MAKKNNSFGKFLAFTTAVAAIGGTCYIFRDKIKACPFYQKSADKLSELKDSLSDKFCNKENDFDFDDIGYEDDPDFEDVFSNAEQGREYTSITINSKEDDSSSHADAGKTEAPEDASTDSGEQATSQDEPAVSSQQETSQDEPTVSNEQETSQDEPTVSSEQETSQDEPAVSSQQETSQDEPKTEEEPEKDKASADDSIPTITFGSFAHSENLSTEDTSKENAATAEVTGYENEGLSDVSEDPDVLEEQDKLDF
jgi:hypothetical protein